MRFTRKCQKLLLSLLFISFIFGIILGISLITNTDLSSGFGKLFSSRKSVTQDLPVERGNNNEPPSQDENELSENNDKNIEKDFLKPKDPQILANPPDIKLRSSNFKSGALDGKESEKLEEMLAKMPEPNYNAHIFYYPWYGNPKVDGNYIHWNHPYLPHWEKQEAEKWPKGKHKPPHDIGSNFYPELGPYSSRDASVLESHMQQIRSTGVGVLAVSWYPPGMGDDNGLSWDDLLIHILDHAARYKLKVCFHIEPFKDRNRLTLRSNIEYIIKTYGNHPAFYTFFSKRRGKELPLFYLYDSYQVGREEWLALLSPTGENTVRGTEYDGVFIGLFVDQKSRNELVSSGFDGFYTYFASDGFTFGSTTRNWHMLKTFAAKENMMFIPSVGPGYNDERVRPWNARNTKRRENGGYYEQSFKAAVNSKADIITITSFNEWHEGTQIEKAVPKSTSDFKYSDYSPMEPDYYLSLTRKWLFKWRKQKKA